MLAVTVTWAVGLWFWLAQGDGAAASLGAAALAFMATVGIGWLSRARAARRFNAALDAYAAREIDRERRWNGPQIPTRAVAFATRRQPVPNGEGR
jgi:hypothetical protein